MTPKPSPFQFADLMEEIDRVQGTRAAIVILENPDGTTIYLRHNIDQENMVNLLKQSYGEK